VVTADKESVVGKTLSDHITKKVVVLVLAMIFTSPFFTVTNYVVEPNTYNYGLDLLEFIGPRTEAGKVLFNNIVKR